MFFVSLLARTVGICSQILNSFQHSFQKLKASPEGLLENAMSHSSAETTWQIFIKFDTKNVNVKSLTIEAILRILFLNRVVEKILIFVKFSLQFMF